MEEGQPSSDHCKKINFVRVNVHNSSWRPPGPGPSLTVTTLCFLLFFSTITAQTLQGSEAALGGQQPDAVSEVGDEVSPRQGRENIPENKYYSMDKNPDEDE